MIWVILLTVLVVVGYLLDREIYFYEGARLGPRIQSWLYDRWARKYDEGKRESQLHDDEMLARPLLERLEDIPEPFLLDFATGTGRLSLALTNRPEFRGRIVAVDLSQGMLEQAAAKLHRAPTLGPAGTVPPPSERVDLLRHTSMPLPFPNASFDVVCCLEVLELLPDAQAALLEMSRLLRPGGILLTSRGTEESGRKAKVRSRKEMSDMLQAGGFENIQIAKWWKLFDRVLASKVGESPPVGSKSLVHVLRCSSCGRTEWTKDRDSLLCSTCGNRLTVTGQGIVLN